MNMPPSATVVCVYGFYMVVHLNIARTAPDALKMQAKL
jgi:hypothetical protein